MKQSRRSAIRILLVDDEESILELYQRVLHEHHRSRSPNRMGQLAAQLFGRRLEDEPEELRFELTFARQASEALRQVDKALHDENPFAVIFMDIRMPPGNDGVWAAEQIRKLDPAVEIILVTGFTDLDPKDIARRVPPLDKLLYIEKPFFPQEIRHFACSLGTKWQTERDLRNVKEELELLVAQRTSELEETNRRLIAEISEHERTEMLREFRGAILERIVAGDRLHIVVDTLIHGLEQLRPELTCILLLPNQDGTHLDAMDSPTLDKQFLEAFRGVPISRDEACCGRAAFLRQSFMLEQIDQGNSHLSELAYHAGIEACWARPLESERQLLGVLAVFFRKSRLPSAFEKRIVDGAVQLIKIAVERHLDEEKLNKLLAAVEQNPTALMITDPKGVVEYANQRYSEISGYGVEEVLGKVADLLRIDEGQELPRSRLATVSAGKPWREELTSIAKTGQPYQEAVVITPIKSADGQPSHLLIMRQDISTRKRAEEERKQLESRLLQAQKMETIGTLAGGIAHDFNNMLTPILGYTEMAMAELLPESEIRGYLQHVMHASGRAKELVKQMLTFSRRDPSEKEPIKINLVVNEAIKLLRAGLPTTIHIEQRIDEDCGLVLANPTQLIQVMMNLGANAKHALRHRGGKISIDLGKAAPARVEELVSRGLPHNQYIQLTVGDTGHGITSGNMARIFEPFFTTKEAGEGTGLGLSVVHGIVVSHGGDIIVESEEELGTRFTVFLPLTLEEAPNHPAIEAARGGAEHILLVDDEEIIAAMVKGMLERQGYRATSFTDPREAAVYFEEHHAEVDLLLTDQTMPHLTGVDLAARALALKPDLPIILVTGFSENVNEENCSELGIRAFLMKPVTTLTMAKTIRQVLDCGN